MTPAVERPEHHRRLLVALVLSVLAIVVGFGSGVDAHASTGRAEVAGTRVAAHDHPATVVVAAPEDVRAGEGRRTTTLRPVDAIGSRVAPQAIAAGADDAASIISRTAQGQSARGVQGLQGYLSPAERAAFAANPSGGSRFLGQAAHRATRDALDEAFPGRFIYRTRGIDFVDTWTGEMIELTTRGQVASHMARPGYRGASYATYWLP